MGDVCGQGRVGLSREEANKYLRANHGTLVGLDLIERWEAEGQGPQRQDKTTWTRRDLDAWAKWWKALDAKP